MKTEFASLTASRSRRAPLFLALCLCATTLAGCKSLQEPGGHLAGYAIVDPNERNPIMVSQQPATMNLSIAPGAPGLSPSQRSQVVGFLQHFRAADAGNSKLVITVPSGGPNEGSAMRAVGQLNGLIKQAGFADNAVQVRAYHSGRHAGAPIRFSYMRYVAQGPHCGSWPTNLARDERNLNYPNFGCAQQANLAAMIANPADLVTPRTMDPADAERRSVVMDRYRQGRPTASDKGGDDNASVKGN